MPPAEVVDVVHDYWYYTKRPTNVYLVVNTSGSMEGSKLATAQGDQSVPGADFAATTTVSASLRELALGSRITPCLPRSNPTRQRLDAMIDRMEATGGTTLIDACAGVATLQQNQPDAINAVVVITDGLENREFQ